MEWIEILTKLLDFFTNVILPILAEFFKIT